jgi:tetratricopeptide (TPR) repeat protein
MTEPSHQECPLCRSLFEEETGDPWRDLLQPALFQLSSLVDRRLQAIPARADTTEIGLILAVGARAYYALGRPKRARKLLDLALCTGVREAHALEAVVGVQPARAVHVHVQYLVRHGTPGERADGACDGALGALRSGKPHRAAAWLEQALSICPEHAEAERWSAYLASAGDQACALLGAFDHREESIESELSKKRRRNPLLGHLADLLPRPWEGQISRQRMQGRHRSFQRGRRADSGSALHFLRETGRTSRWLDNDRAYADLRDTHARVRAELAFDRARALLAQGQSVCPAAEQAWRLAPALDLPHRSRLTQLLVLLAFQDPSAGPVAEHATSTVLEEFPHDPDLLAARAGALAVAARPKEALIPATLALKSHRGASLGMVLAVEALRRSGAEQTARKELARRAQHAEHAWIADVWLMDLNHPPWEGVYWDLADV